MIHAHHGFLTEGLGRLRSRSWLTQADLDGELIARSSLTVEPILCELIDGLVPRRGAFRILEVGCGTGAYIRHAAGRNRELIALGLELHPGVADAARKNIDVWGLSERVAIETGDVRDREPSPNYDLITLHNNIYYFPPESRAALLRLLRDFLRPSGRIVVTTWYIGGGLGAEGINLWFSLVDGCGRLPRMTEMLDHLREAGYVDIRYRRLIPFEAYGAFVAKNQ
jgi:SAM-dependent methyltransferase